MGVDDVKCTEKIPPPLNARVFHPPRPGKGEKVPPFLGRDFSWLRPSQNAFHPLILRVEVVEVLHEHDEVVRDELAQ